MSCKNCKKWTTLTVALVFLALGLILAIFWNMLFKIIVKYELSLSDSNTKGYNMWKETPIPMYLEFHLFNWTNSEEFQKDPTIKPIFAECGPYVYYEHHIRENVTFNDNNTITYRTKRTWRFLPEKSKGSLKDKLTTLNPIAVTVANFIKDDHYLIRKIVNFLFEDFKVTLTVTKTVDEFLFEGYDDNLLKLAQKINITGLNVPYKKFGWFVERNGSIDYDGVFNMNNGAGDINKLGLIELWNNFSTVPYYKGDCGLVNGTSGELWYPPKSKSEISIFATDLCSSIKLHLNGTEELHGVEGHKFIGIDDNFDNGTLYAKSKCFTTDGVPLRSGLRNVTLCKFNAPAFVSYPHFYLADPFYRAQVIGMNPDPENHRTKIVLEPDTGLPLKVNAAFQLNLFLQQIDAISIFSKVRDIYMPAMWFRQSAEMTESLTNEAKLLLVLPAVGNYTGYGLIGISVIWLMVFAYISYRNAWKCKEEEQLLNQQSL